MGLCTQQLLSLGDPIWLDFGGCLYVKGENCLLGLAAGMRRTPYQFLLILGSPWAGFKERSLSSQPSVQVLEG